ncbi:hypothetical protein NFI96_002070 [Prochilodus magdalenae]|nr:hypothetical protein NFI96_002070 [Prochilodus magdalenae]
MTGPQEQPPSAPIPEPLYVPTGDTQGSTGLMIDQQPPVQLAPAGTDSTLVWLVTAAIAGSFFLLVVSVFLRLLCPRGRKQNQYTLARQNSTFSSSQYLPSSPSLTFNDPNPDY